MPNKIKQAARINLPIIPRVLSEEILAMIGDELQRLTWEDKHRHPPKERRRPGGIERRSIDKQENMDQVNYLDLGADNKASALTSHGESLPAPKGVGKGEDDWIHQDTKKNETAERRHAEGIFDCA